jgi:hypothetical protein
MNREIKPILGLMWILISQFNLASVTEEGMAAKEALLLWCHKKVRSVARSHTGKWTMPIITLMSRIK